MSESVELEPKNAFIDRIIKTLQDNGFPNKRVTLPLEKMYEAADAKKINFNHVLDELAEQGIMHEKLAEKILFYPQQEETDPLQNSTYHKIFDRFKEMDPNDMMKNAQNILSSMSPEELQAIQALYQKMPPAQREELAKKAKDMGY